MDPFFHWQRLHGADCAHKQIAFSLRASLGLKAGLLCCGSGLCGVAHFFANRAKVLQ
jgi:hypothetical protein